MSQHPGQRRRSATTRAYHRTCLAALAATAMLGLAGPAAAAGDWIPGGSYDPNAGVAVYFLRYVAPGEAGQMTIRCMESEGVTIDAGVTGDGPPPAGVQRDTQIPAVFKLYRKADGGDQVVGTFQANGLPRARGDNSIVVTVGGHDIDGLVKALVQPLDRVEMTIGDSTATVGIGSHASGLIENLSKSCPAWPG